MLAKLFLESCENGDLDRVKSAMAAGPVNQRLGLIKACIAGHQPVIFFLFDTHSMYHTEMTVALGQLALHGHSSVIDAIMFKYESSKHYLRTIATHACFGGHESLLEKVFDKCEPLPKVSVLYYACKAGRINIINKLINTYETEAWNTGLRGACEGGQLEIAKLMIECGADQFDDGLDCASEHGHLELAKFMKDKGASDWDSALLSACEGGKLNTAQFALDNGAGNIQRSFITACRDGGNVEIVKILLSRGESVNMHQALYDACHANHIDIVKLLLTLGPADVKHCLRIACEHNYSELAQLILCPIRKMELDAILSQALSKKHIDICVLLLRHGATITDDVLPETFMEYFIKSGITNFGSCTYVASKLIDNHKHAVACLEMLPSPIVSIIDSY